MAKVLSFCRILNAISVHKNNVYDHCKSLVKQILNIVTDQSDLAKQAVALSNLSECLSSTIILNDQRSEISMI